VRCLITLVYIGTSLREWCRERIVDVAARRGNVWNARSVETVSFGDVNYNHTGSLGSGESHEAARP
jgi:hypothetical protein